MPSIAAHMVVGKLVNEKLKINSDDFIKGNLLPDIINKEDSHHKVKGKYFLIPDIEYFKKNLDLDNDLYLGYLVHLLLDKYFLEEYVPMYIMDLNIFANGIMYEEYSLINYKLVKKFNLDIEKLNQVLSNYDVDINDDRLKDNLKSLNNKEIGKNKYLLLEDFSNFLYNISNRISEELREYASESNKLFIHTR